MLPLARAATIVAALLLVGNAAAYAATTRSPVRVPAPNRMTLLEYARARANVSTAFEGPTAPARFMPRAVMAPDAAGVLRSHANDAYLLYVSAIAPNGAGTVDIYPGWIHGSHPPLIGKISGLDSPSSLAIDRFGTLYVCQTNVNAPVLVFPFLSREPARRLKTEGALPVSVAVAPNGTVYVSTAQYGSRSPSILTYLPGATSPTTNFSGLAGDAVASLRSDDRGNAYFSAVYIGAPGYIGKLASRSIRDILNFASDAPVSNIELDFDGNLLALTDGGGLAIYSHGAGTVLGDLSVSESQSLTFSNTYRAFYTAGGTITKYAYPSGKMLDTITSLTADSTFGLATFPRVPYASAAR